MWAAATLVTPPASPALALADVKEFARIEAATTDFDTQLTAFAAVAVEQIEAICGIRLAPQTVDLCADEWDDLAHLPIGPVTAVSAVHYLDRDGAEQLLDPAKYELAGTGLARAIRLKVGAGWPNDLRDVPGVIRVTAAVGYAVLPKPLWAAALYLTGDQFVFRETAVTGTIAAKVPMSASVEAMLTNYRIWMTS